jgi:small subunit ribosomal protein S4e
MSERGGSLRHVRRSVAPPFWPISRKRFVWAVKPIPGPHPAAKSIPIGVLLRDALKYAYTMSEARRILGERKVYVDWRVVTDYKFPVGLMDVIYLRSAEEYYRVLPHPTKFFMLHRIDEKEAELKPLRVKRKVTVKGGRLQLTFHDGRTLLVGDSSGAELRGLRTYDTVLMNLRSKAVEGCIKLDVGVLAYVIDGRNVGFIGRVESIQQILKRAKAVTALRGEGGEIVRTILEYVFAIGAEKPVISLPTPEEVKSWEETLSKVPPL